MGRPQRPGKLLEPARLGGHIGEVVSSDIPQYDGQCDISDISVSSDIPQCDTADISVSSDITLDLSVNSDFLPYSNNHLHDDSLPDEENDQNQSIQVVVGNRRQDWWYDKNLPGGWIPRTNNITVHRDNRKILASKLPTIFVTNHRSYFPKFYNFLDAMKTLDLTLGLHSEIWEVKENKTHQNKIEEALEMEGVQYISNPRPDRKGGGAAISLLAGSFTLTRLEIIVPKNLEVVWGIVRPKVSTQDFSRINPGRVE